jgi:hypothetical protein
LPVVGAIARSVGIRVEGGPVGVALPIVGVPVGVRIFLGMLGAHIVGRPVGVAIAVLHAILLVVPVLVAQYPLAVLFGHASPDFITE